MLEGVDSIVYLAPCVSLVLQPLYHGCRRELWSMITHSLKLLAQRFGRQPASKARGSSLLRIPVAAKAEGALRKQPVNIDIGVQTKSQAPRQGFDEWERRPKCLRHW